MSDPSSKSDNGAKKNQKQNLPSWMASRENESKSQGKKQTDGGRNEENRKTEKSKQAKGQDSTQSGGSLSSKTEHTRMSAVSSLSTTDFSKLLEGVVIVLSGFVNPERSTLRSQALEMGAAYQADWNSDCTLLVCAFPNTPKFRQVEADCGTIISKDWILECHKQKKLVDIENYIMHAGKPWRKGNISHETSEEETPSRKPQKVERGSQSKPITSTSSKSKNSYPGKDRFSPSELKKWAAEDLTKTISWLESQEEKPEQSEIEQIAAEGILTCLQDTIDSLEQKKDVRNITEQWQCVPRVVEELAKLESSEKGLASVSKEDLCNQAKACKRIYEKELHRLESDSLIEKKKRKTGEGEKSNNARTKSTPNDAAGYDSDETIEMTEEEIELAYKTMTS